jgi:outer membrane biosynthesis protein TonB
MKKILIVIFALVFAGCNENVENSSKPDAVTKQPTAAEVANKQLQTQLSEQAEAHASEVDGLKTSYAAELSALSSENEALAATTEGQIAGLTAKIDELNIRLIEPLGFAQDRAKAAEEIAIASQARLTTVQTELADTQDAIAEYQQLLDDGEAYLEQYMGEATATIAGLKTSLANSVSSASTATNLGWSATAFAAIACVLVFFLHRKRKQESAEYQQLSEDHSLEVGLMKTEIAASDADLKRAVDTARDVAKTQQAQHNGNPHQPKKWKAEDKKPQQQKPQQQKPQQQKPQQQKQKPQQQKSVHAKQQQRGNAPHEHKAGDTFTNKQLVQAPGMNVSSAEAKAAAGPTLGGAMLEAVNEDLASKGEPPILHNENPDPAVPTSAQLQDLKQNFGVENASQ